MGGSSATESEDGMFSTDSPMSNDGDNIGGSSNGGVHLKRGPWTSAEDAILVDYVRKHGERNWNAVQKHSGLSRCGKSCRLRWANHLRPNLKKGAFTSNEERLIIELHAKMGNKWARMAAHLPGRTDNEIKNYWNTRIKRRQRAGLPLYPPGLCPQENQQQQSSPGLYGGDKACHDILQSNCYETPDVMFNSCDSIPSYTPEFPDISASGTTVDGFSYPQFYKFVPQTIGFQKHTEKRDEPMSEYVANEAPLFDRVQPDNRHDHKMSQSLCLSFPFDPDHKKLLPYSVDQDSRFMSNVIFSASKHFSGAQKLELPSLQYHETGLGIWDPPPQSIDSDPLLPHSTPHSSGLLEDLLHEAKALSKSENQSSKTFSTKVNPGDMTDSSAMKTCSMEFKGYMDYSTPSGNSMESIFNGCTLTGSIGSSLEKKTPERNVKSEVFDQTCILDGEKKEILNQLECYRPDSLLGSGWVKQSAYFPKQRGSVTDAISALMGDGLGPELNNTSTSTGDFGSCIWNNMPSVYQNREISRPPGGVMSRDN